MHTSFKSYLESKGYSKSSIVTYQKDVYTLITWLDNQNIEIENTSYNDLLAYIKDGQNNGNKQRTIQARINSVSVFFKYQIVNKLRTDNPATGIKVHGIKRKILYHILSPAQLENLCQYYKEDTLKDKRNRVVVGLYIYQGITTTELSRLRVIDVDLINGKIKIPSTRKSKERTLELKPQQILGMLNYIKETREKLLKQSGLTTDQLILTGGERNQIHGILNRISRELRKEEEDFKSFKQVRASVITHWLKQYDLRQTQYMAGHRYVSSTEHYQINNLEDLKNDIVKHHPLG